MSTATNFIELGLDDTRFFGLTIGRRVLKKHVYKATGTIPIYSANVTIPFGYTSKKPTNVDFEKPHVLWGIDSYFELTVKQKDEVFVKTDHCGSVEIKTPNIVPEYIWYQLNRLKAKLDFDRTWRPSLKNMNKVKIKMPILSQDANGIKFDLNEQQRIAQKFKTVQLVKRKLQLLQDEIQQLEEQADKVIIE
jgi:hypothetical protein